MGKSALPHHLLTKSIIRHTQAKISFALQPGPRRRPGPKGPSRELIDAVVEMKRRNPYLGCRKIAEQIAGAFGIKLNKDIVRRILVR